MKHSNSLFTYNKKDEEIANVLSPIAWLANKLYAIEEKSKEVANAYRMDLVYCL